MELVWHRNDLRVHDHPALNAAVAGGPCLGLVIIEPRERNYFSIRRQAWFNMNVRELSRAFFKYSISFVLIDCLPYGINSLESII